MDPDKMFKEFQTQVIVDVVGWYGTAAILGAYFLISFGFIAATGALYQLLNITGAVAIVIISIYKKLPQVVALDTAWAIIGIVALIKMFL